MRAIHSDRLLLSQSSRLCGAQLPTGLAPLQRRNQTLSECEHSLSLRDKVFANKGRGRRCTKCGAHVYVDSPWLEGLATVSPFFLVFLIAFAWVDGGIHWFWLAAFIAAHVAIYLLELGLRNPIEFDFDDYQRVSKVRLWEIAVVLILAVGVGVLLWLS